MRITMKGGVWKNSEDEILKAAVMKYGINNWSRVASLVVRKSAKQCKARWYEWLDPGVKKTEWTREEEEKLLHLAKLFPTQWRTIAPIVGRTAHQCLDHYEKLLDQAQGKDLSNDPNDPRRIRPGEIDPNPETKPSRADPVDMDEDEKEMLSEARARLANTRGKKAKRKAREKQLEEARRLASLQKRRELKAAGIQVGRMRKSRRDQIDYSREVPFEEQPPAGFHQVGPEEMPEGNLGMANISLQQLEGRRRDEEESRNRKDDKRKMKRLQEHDLPKAMEIIEQLNDPQAFRKRTKLTLPQPQLSDQELEAIVRMGNEAGASPSSSSSGMILGEYNAAPTLTPMRTPAKDNTLILEAQNAVARINAPTPLEGGENPKMQDIPTPSAMRTPLSVRGSSDVLESGRTPSAIGLSRRTAAGTASCETTPLSVATGTEGGITPLRDDLSLNEKDHLKSIKATQAMVKEHLMQSLKALPQPQNEIDIALPDEPVAPVLGDKLVEDAEDVLIKQTQLQAAKKEADWLKETQVVQQNLPRPYFPETAKYPLNYTDSSKTRDVAGMELLMKAEEILKSEVQILVLNDAIKHPVHKSVRPPRNVAPLEDIPIDALGHAAAALEVEISTAKESIGDMDSEFESTPGYLRAWDDVLNGVIYSPMTKTFVPLHSVSKNDRLDSCKLQFESLKRHVQADAKRGAKLEQKLGLCCDGYKSRQSHLLKSIEDNWSNLNRMYADYEAFTAMKEQEGQQIINRLKEMTSLIDSEKSRHNSLQKRYSELQIMKEELETILRPVPKGVKTCRGGA